MLEIEVGRTLNIPRVKTPTCDPGRRQRRTQPHLGISVTFATHRLHNVTMSAVCVFETPAREFGPQRSFHVINPPTHGCGEILVEYYRSN